MTNAIATLARYTFVNKKSTETMCLYYISILSLTFPLKVNLNYYNVTDHYTH